MFLKLLSTYLHHVLQFPDKITNDELQKHVSFHNNTTRDVLGSGGGVARGVRTVECIVASEVDQCQLCLVDMQKGVDSEACIQNNDLLCVVNIKFMHEGWVWFPVCPL